MLKTIELPIESRAPIFDKLLTVEELADAIGITPKTIRNWVSRREIPHVKIGGKTRFRKGSIEAWLSRKEMKACQ